MNACSRRLEYLLVLGLVLLLVKVVVAVSGHRINDDWSFLWFMLLAGLASTLICYIIYTRLHAREQAWRAEEAVSPAQLAPGPQPIHTVMWVDTVQQSLPDYNLVNPATTNQLPPVFTTTNNRSAQEMRPPSYETIIQSDPPPSYSSLFNSANSNRIKVEDA